MNDDAKGIRTQSSKPEVTAAAKSMTEASRRTAPRIRYRKRGVERTKLQVYVSNEVFDHIYALARQMKVSMGAAVEKLTEGKVEVNPLLK